MTATTNEPVLGDLNSDTINSLVTALSSQDLEPLSPEDAVEMYIRSREDEVAPSTLKTHRSRLSFFLTWCAENDIDEMNDLTGRDLQRYKNWRKENLSPSTLESNMRTVRLFLTKCVKFDAVQPHLPQKVDVPNVTGERASRDDIIPAETAAKILRHLDKFEYARTEHVVWLLLVEAGLRTCTLHGLDIGDFTATKDGGELRVRHRPASGTRLKNGENSERVIHISTHVTERIEDYLSEHRPNVKDDFGRSPLLASEHGRLSKSTIRKYVYKWTRPCVVNGECPAGIPEAEFESCEARRTSTDAYRCPSSKSPHAIRRGYLTSELDAGIPKAVLADRCDVTPDVIDEYYDKRSPEERMRLRKEIRESVYGDGDAGGYGRD